MITGLFKFTPDGRKKVPSRYLVLHWMKQSWREIPEEMVRKSFLTSSKPMQCFSVILAHLIKI